MNTPEQMRQRIAELEEGLNNISRFTPEMAENLAYWIDTKSPHNGVQEGLHRLAGNLRRAASLLTAAPPASEPDADVVERVAKAMYVARVGTSQNCYEFDDLNSEGQHHIYDGLMLEARAALSAMRPAIDWEKIAEIRRAYDAWRAADTRCALLADPEDEGSPSERQEAAEEAAWAWDQAASKLMLNADALLAMIGGGDE